MHFKSVHFIKILVIFMLKASKITAQEQCITPILENGYCVHYKECPYVMEINRRYGLVVPSYYKDYIIKSKCSGETETTIRLCCKMKENYIPASPVTELLSKTRLSVEDLDESQDFFKQLNKKGFNILNDLECGTTNGVRVAGGNETDLYEFPWVALLRYDAPDDPYLCGGSLITNRFVLTAAHCVNRPLTPLVGVRLGEYDLSTTEDCKTIDNIKSCSPPVEDFGIDQIIAHPKYNERQRINDIALIKLDRDIEFKKHIKPVCLPITPDSIKMKSEHRFLITGFGLTEKGSKSNILLKAHVAHYERALCQNVYHIAINQKHLCAGDLLNGCDTCHGDSGGPLLLFSKYKNFKCYIQYGVVAAGGRSCNLSQALPGIYTNIIPFVPWITNNIV